MTTNGSSNCHAEPRQCTQHCGTTEEEEEEEEDTEMQEKIILEVADVECNLGLLNDMHNLYRPSCWNDLSVNA